MLIGLYSPTMQSGKSTVAIYLESKTFFKISFAYPIKIMLEMLLENLGVSSEDALNMVFNAKSSTIPYTNVSVRHALQTLGTEWGRNLIDPNLWISCASDAIDFYRNDSKINNFVIDDLRFENEAKWIKEQGGYLIKVIRPGFERDEKEHSSEGSLDNFQFDGIIINDGTEDDLKLKVENLLKTLI